MDGLDSFKAAIEKRKQLELADLKHEEGQVQTLQTQEIIAKSFKSLIDYLDNRVSKTAVVNQLQEIGTPDALKVVDSINQLHETIKTHENTDLTEITKVMNDLLTEAKQLPKELPTIPEAKDPKDYSKDFEKLTTAIKAVEKVVQAQELVAEAPVIPETQVNVEAPDLKPLQTSIKDVVKAVKAIVIPEAKLDTQPVEKLLKRSNVLLNELLEKPVGGGGGGGSTWIATNSEGIPVPIELTVDGKIPVESGATSTYESRNDTTTDTNLVYLGKAIPGTATSAASWQIKRYNKSAGHMSFADDVTTFTKEWDSRTSYSY